MNKRIVAGMLFTTVVCMMLGGCGFTADKENVKNSGAEMLSKVSYLSVSSEGETSEIDLCLKDKDVNALKLIVDFGKQFTGM